MQSGLINYPFKEKEILIVKNEGTVVMEIELKTVIFVKNLA
jgi:hypothetical protein